MMWMFHCVWRTLQLAAVLFHHCADAVLQIICRMSCELYLGCMQLQTRLQTPCATAVPQGHRGRHLHDRAGPDGASAACYMRVSLPCACMSAVQAFVMLLMSAQCFVEMKLTTKTGLVCHVCTSSLYMFGLQATCMLIAQGDATLMRCLAWHHATRV